MVQQHFGFFCCQDDLIMLVKIISSELLIVALALAPSWWWWLRVHIQGCFIFHRVPLHHTLLVEKELDFTLHFKFIFRFPFFQQCELCFLLLHFKLQAVIFQLKLIVSLNDDLSFVATFSDQLGCDHQFVLQELHLLVFLLSDVKIVLLKRTLVQSSGTGTIEILSSAVVTFG